MGEIDCKGDGMMLQIPASPVPGLTYGERWSEGGESGYWVGLATNPRAGMVRAVERCDLDISINRIIEALTEEVDGTLDARPFRRGRRIEIRQADPTLLLVESDRVIGAWPLDRRSAEDYLAASEGLVPDYFDRPQPSGHESVVTTPGIDPADYGDRMTGDNLPKSLREAMA